MKKSYPSEEYECIKFSEWLTSHNLPHTHIPNGMFTRSWSIKNRNKNMGVSAGFPDYCVVLSTGPIFIEMKKQKGGKVSDEQKYWLSLLTGAGVAARVCKGFEEAKSFVEGELEKCTH